MEAVVIFFILSGIVIHISQQKNPKSSGKFIENRFKRLYPLYVMGLALGFAFSRWNTPMAIGNLFFLGTLQGYITSTPVFNPVLWSLSFEMFFYFMFYLYLRTGSKSWFLLIWSTLSIICIPLYYLHIPGVAGHFISMLAFSSIWLLGYLVSANIARLPSVTLSQALFAFGLLFISSRIRYTNEYFCVIKYLVFSIVSLPVFIYCLKGDHKASVKLNWLYLLIAYAVLLIALRTISDSLAASKIIYSICPPVCFLASRLLTVNIRSLLLRAGSFLGFISYSLYVVHYPIQHFLSFYLNASNGILVILIITGTILPLAYMLEWTSRWLFLSGKKRQSLQFRLTKPL
jgi:peptidoglycan/LPS O-acetylase OafA/YrhL